MPITENDLSGVHDGDVFSASGEKIGSVGQVYLDDQTGEPTFVTANTGLFGMSQSFVPLRGARVEDGRVIVDFDKTTVKDAPRIDDDGSLTPIDEDQLYAYYGMSTANPDNADYGTADQTPEPGFAQAGTDDRPDLTPGDSRLGDRTDDVRSSDGRTGGIGTDDVRTDADDRPDLVPGDSRLADRSEGMTPDAPPADRDRDGLDRNEDDNAAPASADEPPASGGSRLRKWVMTEYEPVKTEEYVEGSGQQGERPTR